jgi:hypothetical protein
MGLSGRVLVLRDMNGFTLAPSMVVMMKAFSAKAGAIAYIVVQMVTANRRKS